MSPYRLGLMTGEDLVTAVTCGENEEAGRLLESRLPGPPDGHPAS